MYYMAKKNKGGARILVEDKKEKVKSKSSHNFLKRVVAFCISFIVLYTAAQIYFSHRLSIELSPVLTQCVYNFFGTELCMTCLIVIVDNIKDCIVSKKKDKLDNSPKEPPGSLG